MFNAIKRGFGYTLGKILFYIFVTILIGLLFLLLDLEPSDLLMKKAHAIELDNSIIATQWNNYFKTSSESNSSSTYYTAPKTFIWSEQYAKFNWYMWEETYHLTDRIEIFKDFITSRTYTNISNTNDIKFVIGCSANFSNNQIHNYQTLITGGCTIYPFVNGANNIVVTEQRMRINGSVGTGKPSNTSYIEPTLGYSITIPANNNNVWLDFGRSPTNTYYNYFRLDDGFFTTPLEDLDTYVATLPVRERKNVSSGSSLVNQQLSTNRIYYQSVPYINGIVNTYYPWDRFLYQSDVTPTFDTSTYTYYAFSDNATHTEQTCHIINDQNTCEQDFVFKSYYDFLQSGGSISTNENGNVDETTTSQTEIDYTSNINAINSNITDPTIDTTDVDQLISNSNFNENETIQNIVSLPIDFIENLANVQCSPINLTLPYLGSLTIPCMSTIYSRSDLDTVIFFVTLLLNGYIIYKFLLKFVVLFNQLKDPTDDHIEVVDL